VIRGVDTAERGGVTAGVKVLAVILPVSALVSALVSACATSPEAPLSSATLSTDGTVRTARAKAGFISYTQPYHRWTIELGTIESCSGDTIAAIELTTLSSVTDLPVGTHVLRTAEMPATVPSSYLRYGANTGISGALTIETVSGTYVTGSFAGMAMINGVATELTADFGASVCL
jgi:hypothetical protein